MKQILFGLALFCGVSAMAQTATFNDIQQNNRGQFPRSAPPLLSGNPAMEGFLAFRQHCIKCHTINGDGGNFGPELNYPVNVTEYWNEEWLARYIADPQSIRTNSKMIPFYRDVKNRQAVISSIILYLKAMKDNKIPDSTLIRSRDKKLIQTFNGGLNSN